MARLTAPASAKSASSATSKKRRMVTEAAEFSPGLPMAEVVKCWNAAVWLAHGQRAVNTLDLAEELVASFKAAEARARAPAPRPDVQDYGYHAHRGGNGMSSSDYDSDV